MKCESRIRVASLPCWHWQRWLLSPDSRSKQTQTIFLHQSFTFCIFWGKLYILLRIMNLFYTDINTKTYGNYQFHHMWQTNPNYTLSFPLPSGPPLASGALCVFLLKILHHSQNSRRQLKVLPSLISIKPKLYPTLSLPLLLFFSICTNDWSDPYIFFKRIDLKNTP